MLNEGRVQAKHSALSSTGCCLRGSGAIILIEMALRSYSCLRRAIFIRII